MIHYKEPLIRPPSEADALIFQVTYGCSHNRCAFCFTYDEKPFRVRPLEEVLEEIDEAAAHLEPRRVTKVFLADGDALALSTDHLLAVLRRLKGRFENLRRISTYASARNILHKEPSLLEALKREGLGMLYIGIESGDDEVLERIRKGVSAEQTVAACRKAAEAGLRLFATVVLGLAGPSLSDRHARNTASILNAARPKFAAALTLMLPANHPFVHCWPSGWRMLDARESLIELRTLVTGIDYDSFFYSNHASNFVPIKGRLPKEKKKILRAIEAAINNPMRRKPEWLRGL